MFPAVVTLVILTLSGFTVGVRPRTHSHPTRSSAWLITSSVIVLLATWVLVSKGCIPLLKAWGMVDLDLIALHFVLGLVAVCGSALLLPTWGYVIGRTITRSRMRSGGKLQSTGVLDGPGIIRDHQTPDRRLASR